MLSLNLLTNFNHVIEIFIILMGLVIQDTLNSNSDDEIDLRELFITLWAYKFLITCACALGIVFGGYYALNAEKEFTSAAIFKIDQSKSGGILLGGELGALASLAGFGGGIATSLLPTDQVTGRIRSRENIAFHAGQTQIRWSSIGCRPSLARRCQRKTLQI